MVTRNRSRLRAWVAVGAATCHLALGGVAASAPSLAPPALPDTLASPDAAPDVLEAMADLDAAEQPVPAADLTRWSVVTPAGHRPGEPLSLQARWRTRTSAGQLRHDVRLEAAAGAAGARGVLRLEPDGRHTVAGAAWWGLGACQVWAGHLTLRHGYGLVAPDPLRRSALTADQSLAAVQGGLAARTATPGAGAGPGIGLVAGTRRWKLAALADFGGQASARASGASGALEWGLLASTDTAATAVSCSGRVARPAFACSWEIATRRIRAGGGLAAAVIGAQWLAAPSLRFEVQSAAADGPWNEGAGVLPVSARSGWALRGAWHERGGATCDILLQGARLQPEASEVTRRSSRVAEAGWSLRPRAGLHAEFRVRRAARGETSWSERQPWEPATVAGIGTRTSAQAGLRWEAARHRLAARWQSLTADDVAASGTRQLVAITWRGAVGAHWATWVESATAWGDPVDLVRGSSPLPGVVASRHWGRCRAEVLAGLTFEAGGLHAGLAAARRETEPDGAALWDAWAEVGGAW